MTDQDQLTQDQQRQAVDIGRLVMAIPMKRWLSIRRRYEVGLAEISEQPEVMLILAANEVNRQDTGRDDYDRFEAMTVTDLNTYLGLDEGADEQPKSGADGGRDRAPQGPGPDLPGAGDQP